ncbi:DUF4349 domain-containing protein [Halobacillus locisalis]|uniref:DUF4349 domain-containing protein n=1 Tax=Halobacillus locisalis TaxID=220753 RepID=A0A838CRM2_9BACI|nr:DUF4349 domain-containing protein [Halobacillus locisalis]MBA2174518.1 DUF4349 domain-containing protein [Halobacillus locisalis]
MKKITVWLFIVLLSAFLAACSNDTQEQGDESSEGNTEETSADQSDSENKTNGLSEAPPNQDVASEESSMIDNTDGRMLIYNAVIELETEDYDQFRQQLDERMAANEAYIVEASISKRENNRRQGQIRLRVPQSNFENLLGGFEEISESILSQNVTGRDVTEEYVDLESRLSAKEKIESRLLTFLEEAEATDSLLKISQDLERVQSEIEVLKGKMNYLQNQSDFSTITLQVTETKVVVPDVGGTSLNTWEKTKQAFASSLNGLTTFVSWTIVTLIGYSPIFIPITFIIVLIWYIKRRRRLKAGS